MDYLSLTIYVCWLLSEIILNRRLRAADSDKQGADKNSIRVIWLTLIVAVTAGSFVCGYIPCPIGDYLTVHFTGLCVIIAGMIMRFLAVRSLGRMFTVDVTIRKDHVLHTSGMYKYLRHPSYTGSLISFVGMGLSLNNWLSLAIIVLPVFASFIFRVNIEEKVLQEQFGDDYRNYMKRSKRFFPFVY